MTDNTSEILEMKSMLKKLIELNATPKRWLNTNEVAHYLGYSKENIHKMVKNNQFQEGLHYYKKVKRLLFDKNAVDSWVVSSSPANNNTSYDEDEMIDDILSSLAA
ncbi:MAG: helix-turn-helix domain-containing protein [Campylobacterota bacterium]|nr:helix-turn-helix domain-containing protein [Campylobacterota bacterium]